MTRVRRGSGKSGDLARESRCIANDELAIGRCAGAIIEYDVNIRCSLERDCSTCDNGVTAAAHRVVDLQYAAVGRFQNTIVGDFISGIDGEDATRDISLDSAIHLVDQRQIAVASANLTGAGDGVIDIGQGSGRCSADNDIASAVRHSDLTAALERHAVANNL